MDDAQKLIMLNEHFNELRDILIRENEDNWIRGINAILREIHFAIQDNDDAKETIRSVSSTYSFMNSGNGSFSEYYIHREGFDERIEANQELSTIKDNIADLMASI